jgi:UDP-N-acetyl-D-glucosamine 4,6-dehydratase
MNKYIRLIILLINDILLCILSIILALVLRTDSLPSFEAWSQPSVIAVILYLLIFSLFKYHNYFFKYFNSKSLKNYFIGFGIYIVSFTALLFFFQFTPIPRSIGLIQPFLFFVLLIFSRYVARAYFKKKSNSSVENSIIIIGDVDSTYKLLDNFGENFNTRYLLSKNESEIGRSILGEKIQPIDKLKNIIKLKPKGLLILSPKILKDLEIYWEDLLKCELRFLQFNKEENSFTLHPIDYHPIIFNEALFDININFYNNKCILVTGAGGSIGSFIARELTNASNVKLILIDHNELNLFNVKKIFNSKKYENINFQLLNILDQKRMIKLFKNYKIDIVIHAAAYKHVGLLESQPEVALENNYKGTKILYELAKKNDISNFLLISTDKAVRPTSLMGVSKRLAELYCLSNKNKLTNLSIVRFGNVIDSSGSVMPIFIDQIQKNLPITVTDKKVRRYFMSIHQAAKLVLEANTFNEHSVFHLDMGRPRNILKLAKNLIKLHGFQPIVSIKEKNEHTRLISITGLKKGEKLYEELLIDKKNKPTLNKRIYASIEQIDFNETKLLFKKIEIYMSNPNNDLLKSLLSSKLINFNN